MDVASKAARLHGQMNVAAQLNALLKQQAGAGSSQAATVRNLLAAWVLTLPVSIVLSGLLFWAFRSFS